MNPEPSSADVLEMLRAHPLFSELPLSDLERLVGKTSPVEMDAGEVLMQEGTPGGSLYLLLEGEFEVTKRSGQQDVQIALRGAGEVFGEISILDRAPRSATLTATRPSSLLELSQEAFEDVIQNSPQAALALLGTITSRLRNTEAMLRQHEKMAALGTLAAGLAHELNNPAAAMGRGAGQLHELLAKWVEASSKLGTMPISDASRKAIEALESHIMDPGAGEDVDPITRSDLEDQLSSWLEAAGMEDGWEYTSWLVSSGWDPQALQALLVGVEAEHTALILRWFAVGVSLHAMADELRQGAERISNLVGSFKTYSYLDQAPAQLVDIRQGLEDTLTVLKHKITPDIQVERRYESDLPRIEAYGSELNQVWTNLIDNALDAIGESGKLILSTEADEAKITVGICDTGPGIPDEIRDRVFEPFYTTKPPGVGTGLGLHIVYNIVCQRHGGSVKIERSDDGLNCIVVELPIESRPHPSIAEQDDPSH